MDLFQTMIFKIKVKFADSMRKFVVDDGGTGGPNVNENAISNGYLTLKSYVKEELKVGCDRTDITYFHGDDTVSVRTLQDFKIALEESSPGNSSSPAAVTFIVTIKDRKPRNDVYSQVEVQTHTDMTADPEDYQLPQNRYGQSASAGTSPDCSGINAIRKRQLQLDEPDGGPEVIDVKKSPKGKTSWHLQKNK